MADEIIKADDNAELYVPSNYSSFSDIEPSQEQRMMVANALNNAESLAEHEDEVLAVIACMTKPGVRRARQKGDVDHPCTDSILICADGTAYFSKSEGVRKALDNFMACGIFTGDIVKIKMVSKKIQGGNTMKTLVLV